MWESFLAWLHEYESVAIWLEGAALVLILFLDWREYRRQGKDRAEQHKETVEQMQIMREQTDAAREAAVAAKTSADALIDSERAWVVAELSPMNTKFSDGRWYRSVTTSYVPLTVEEGLAGHHLRHKLKLTNMGRTPAHILAFEMRYTCLAEGVTDLPDVSVGSDAQMREFEQLLNGGATLEVDEEFDVFALIKDSLDELRSLKKRAVFYGSVRYRHMFSAGHACYADFCYVYTPSQERLSRVGRYSRQGQGKAAGGRRSIS